MKKILVTLSAILLVLAGCSSSTSKDDSKCENGLIYMVTDSGGVDDKSFNQGTYEGIQEVVDAEDGVCSSHITSNAEADYVPNLTTATDENPNLVVAAGYLFIDAMNKVASDNPDQQYLLIDELVQDKNGKQLPNVASAVFAAEEGSYLVGVAAATKAIEDGYTKVGFIGGMEGPLIKSFEAGYTAGVKSVDPEMEVQIAYTGSFSDAALGKIEAGKMYNDGVYVIYQAAGNSGNGVIQEAQERYSASADGEEGVVWAIGVDRDQYEDGLVKGTDHSVILTSMVKKVGTASSEVSKKTLAGEPQGGKVLTFNLENEGVGIPEKNPNLSDDVIAAVEAAKELVISGEVKVPNE